MIETKVQICWQYYESLPETKKQTQTAKHLRAACEAAKMLLKKVEELEEQYRNLSLECEEA